jgi:hypothetical protein
LQLTHGRENDISDSLFLTFSTDDESFGETRVIDLKPGGRDIDVTNENKKEYIEHVARLTNTYRSDLLTISSLVTTWRIQKRVEEQFNAFATGFNELIPPDLVNVFDERELELLIGGIADIDVEDWKKHTDYRGYTESDPVIQNFWKVCLPPISLSYSPSLLNSPTVHPRLGPRAEIPPPAVRNRHVPHTGQRLQGSTRQRRPAKIHDREDDGRCGRSAEVSYLVCPIHPLTQTCLHEQQRRHRELTQHQTASTASIYPSTRTTRP